MLQHFSSLNKIILFIGCILFTVGSVPVDQTNRQSDELLEDVTASELQEIIASYEGEKAILINIWATWCAPCVEEFPEIVELQRHYPDKLKVIFISADFPDSRDRALEFLKKQNVDWTT